MNHKILKVFSLLLALTLLVVSSGISAVAADIQLPENSDISKLGIQSKVEGNKVTVELVAAADLYFYTLHGYWEMPSNFKLIQIGSDLKEFANVGNYGNVEDGEVSYVDFSANPNKGAAPVAAGTVLVRAVYEIAPSAGAGDYTIGFTSDYFLELAENAYTQEATQTAKFHVHKDATTDKDHICDAIGCDAVLNDCVPGDAATCTLPQQCTVCDKVLKDALDHAWGEPTYINNGNGTHTATSVCGNDATHISEDTKDHDFTNGSCICGAKNPLTVVYKGAALANAFTVEGNVVTVTFSAACKVGYWDAAAGKYVAISATKIADNTYSFTVPAGVNEVLLVVKGDMNGDGKLATRDYNMLKSAFLKKTLTSVQIFVADVNNDGSITSRECNQLKSACLGKYNYAW